MTESVEAFEKFRARWAGRPHPKAQLDQDLFVLFATQEKRGGYFVEFGACDGVTLSNTLLLERDYGWSGIVAEPNPRWHKALKANRKCEIDLRCVMAESGKTESFIAAAAALEARLCLRRGAPRRSSAQRGPSPRREPSRAQSAAR